MLESEYQMTEQNCTVGMGEPHWKFGYYLETMKECGCGVMSLLFFSPFWKTPVYRFYGFGAKHLTGRACALPRSLAEALQCQVSGSLTTFGFQGFWAVSGQSAVPPCASLSHLLFKHLLIMGKDYILYDWSLNKNSAFQCSWRKLVILLLFAVCVYWWGLFKDFASRTFEEYPSVESHKLFFAAV